MLIETSTTWVTRCTHFHVQFYTVQSNVILTRGKWFRRIIEVMMLNRSWPRRNLSMTDHTHINCWSCSYIDVASYSSTFVSSQEHLWRSAQITQCQVVGIWCHPKRSAPRLVSWSLETLRLPESCRVLINANRTKPHADDRYSNFKLECHSIQVRHDLEYYGYIPAWNLCRNSVICMLHINCTGRWISMTENLNSFRHQELLVQINDQ